MGENDESPQPKKPPTIFDKLSNFGLKIEPALLHQDIDKQILVAKVENKPFNVYVAGNLTINLGEKSPEKIQAKELFEKRAVGWAREDIIKAELEVGSPDKDSQKTISDFRPYLNEIDLGALATSLRIVELEETKNKADNETAKELCKNLQRRGKRESTIYNFVRSGIMERDVLRYLRALIVAFGNPQEVRTKFASYWKIIVDFHPTALFVGETMIVSDITNQTLARFTKGSLFVEIYTRGKHIELGQRAAKKLTKEGYDVKERPYKLGKTKACIFTVTKNS